MTTFTSKTFKSFLSSGAAVLALSLALPMLAPQAAFADDCLLDRNNNGDVDLSDDDAGADSGGEDFSLACGFNAAASGTNSTALGAGADATTTQSTAIGFRAQATGENATAIGGGDTTATAARATGAQSIAIGGGNGTDTDVGALASGSEAIAIGNNTEATGAFSVAQLFRRTSPPSAMSKKASPLSQPCRICFWRGTRALRPLAAQP